MKERIHSGIIKVKFRKTIFGNIIAEVYMWIIPKSFEGYNKKHPYWSLIGAYPFDKKTGDVGLVKTWYKGDYFSSFGNYDNEIRDVWNKNIGRKQKD